MYVTGEYWERHRVPELLQPDVDASLREKISRLKEKYGMFEPALFRAGTTGWRGTAEHQ